MEAIILAVFCGVFLAYANGANDNFKGVATLLGSGTTNYRRALYWATISTFAGSLAAFFLATGLLASFSGKGLVETQILSQPNFAISVSFAAATTVFLATRFGFPISTTHALIGSIVGAGLSLSASGVNFVKLSTSFLAPLLLSPIIAIVISYLLYLTFRHLREKFGIMKETCICLGTEVVQVFPGSMSENAVAKAAYIPTITVEAEIECAERYAGSLLGINAETLLDKSHYVSSGILSFARGLNDTPKIAALLLTGVTISPAFAIVAVGVFIAIGGLMSARRVAETMSHKITEMNHGQGFTANLVTGVLVIFASKLGMPVSTTHVSCGSLFGIGAVTGQGQWNNIFKILLAWIITLPIAAIIAAISASFLF